MHVAAHRSFKVRLAKILTRSPAKYGCSNRLTYLFEIGLKKRELESKISIGRIDTVSTTVSLNLNGYYEQSLPIIPFSKKQIDDDGNSRLLRGN